MNANSFQFGFSIFILGMVILGGLGSIWGVVIGAILLSFVNIYLIPDVLDQASSATPVGPRSTSSSPRSHSASSASSS